MPRRDPSPLRFSDPARGQRLQRVLADAGVAARRACEVLIEQGHVRVNDEVITRLPAFVDPEQDRIEVDGRPIPKPARPVYIMLHKPSRTLTAPGERADDDRPRADALIDHPSRPRLFPVGGLDFDSTGLMLYTNDGEMANRLTHPRYNIERVYHAKIKGQFPRAAADQLAKGVFVFLDEQDRGDQSQARPPQPQPRPRPRDQSFTRGKPDGARKIKLTVRPLDPTGDHSEIEIIAKQGRDAEIAKALTVVGFPPRKLTRVAMGPLVLRGLAQGRWRELEREELRQLRKLVKSQPALAPRPARPGAPRSGSRPASPAATPRPLSSPTRARPRVIGGS